MATTEQLKQQQKQLKRRRVANERRATDLRHSTGHEWLIADALDAAERRGELRVRKETQQEIENLRERVHDLQQLLALEITDCWNLDTSGGPLHSALHLTEAEYKAYVERNVLPEGWPPVVG